MPKLGILSGMDNRIDIVREEKGMSVNALAETLGVPRSTLNKLRRGERKITTQWLERFAKALDCYPSELLPVEWQKPLQAPAPSDPNLSKVAIDAILIATGSGVENPVDLSGIDRYELQKRIETRLIEAKRSELVDVDEVVWLVRGIVHALKSNSD